MSTQFLGLYVIFGLFALIFLFGGLTVLLGKLKIKLPDRFSWVEAIPVIAFGLLMLVGAISQCSQPPMSQDEIESRYR
jgi:putative Ca2+/H+ antiporter (TMEM165/GDT1 family)